jgi:type IV pilus assembly protein PilA
MASPCDRQSPSPIRNPKSRIKGFTLVELLVVIGIILLVIGIATPMLLRAYRAAERTRVAGDLQAVATALEAYNADHGQYPAVTATGQLAGSRVLVQALIAPAPRTVDGHDGPGFRIPPPADPNARQGRVYGPYIPPDRFQLRDEGTQEYVMLDRFGSPILYFPARTTRPNLSTSGAYVGTTNAALYNREHNSILPLDRMRAALEADLATGALPANRVPRYSGPYLLWSAGTDTTFGTDSDITNFNMTR